MVPKEVLLEEGFETEGLASSVWFRRSKYSTLNSKFVSRYTGKVRMTAPSQFVTPGPRSDPFWTLPKPVPGPELTGTAKAALFSQLTQDRPAGQSDRKSTRLN